MPKSKFLTKKTSFRVFRQAYKTVWLSVSPKRNPPALSTLRIKKTHIRANFPQDNYFEPSF